MIRFVKLILKNSSGSKGVRGFLMIGDKVAIWKGDTSGPLAPKWEGGLSVTRFVEPDAYVVSDGSRTFRRNKRHVKKEVSSAEKGNVGSSNVLPSTFNKNCV